MPPLKLTVLMALYNGGDYLKHSIRSVLNQTCADFEFLIINDCSTDNSLQVVASFNDTRIKVYHNACNMGQTKSLNVGLKLACGEYIARMDADDLAFPNWLQRQIDFIEGNPAYSVVSTNALVIDESNKIKKIYRPPRLQEEVLLRSLISSPINHVGSIFRKCDILDNGGYDETYKTAADYDLWGKLLRNRCKITATNEILVAIREHPQSLSRSERGKRETAEIVDIAGRNIGAFTNAGLSGDEVNLFCKAHYDAGTMTEDEFIKALRITKRVYRSLRPTLRIGDRKATQWLDNRYETIYLKRIFSFIVQKNRRQAQKLCRETVKNSGAKGKFLVLAALSFLGGKLFDDIPVLYERVLAKKACLGLNGKLKAVLNYMKTKILICGILPPPFFGHSTTYKNLMESAFVDAFEVTFLDMRFWSYEKHKKVTLTKLSKLLKYFFQYVYLILRYRPRYVLYNMSFDKMPFLKDVLFCSVGKLLGCRIILHDMGQYVRELYDSSGKFYQGLVRWLLKNVTASIILGERIKVVYKGFIDEKRLFVVPGGVEDTRTIETTNSRNRFNGDINVLFFSFMSKSKGVLTAFKAVPKVLAGDNRLRFIFAGPVESESVQAALNQLKQAFNARVEYLGYIGDVLKRTEMYRSSDIFIFPTHRDAFGLVLLHAMAEAVPIVASQEGSIPEIVQDGINGFLVEKGNANQLAQKILTLAKDSQLRQKIGAVNRRRYLDIYSPQQYGKRMIDAFVAIDKLG